MAGPPQFVTDEQILKELKRPFGLAYSACFLGTSLERARSIRDKHKTEIVTERVGVYKQRAEQIAFQLELIDKLDSLKNWCTTHENRRHDPEQKQISD